MKSLSAVFFALLFTPLFALGAPELSVPQPKHDFGEARSGEKVDHRFVLKNTGNDTLKILRIRTSCGCTTPGVREMEIPPGEQAELPVQMNLHGRSGPQKQQVVLTTNDPDNRMVTLRMSGEAVPLISIDPRTLNLKLIRPGEKAEGVITLTSRTGEPFEVTNVKSTRDKVDLRVTHAKDGLSATIHVSPRPMEDEEAQGHFTDVLLIDTSEKEVRNKRVLVMWQISTGMILTPGRLSLVIGDDPRPLNRYFMLRGHAGLKEPLKVTNVEWPGRDDIRITTKDTERFGWRIHLEDFIPDPSMDGEHILVHTNAEGNETLKIPVAVRKK